MNEEQANYHFVAHGPILVRGIHVQKGYVLSSAASTDQVKKPLFVYRTTSGVFVNCAKIVSAPQQTRNNVVYFIDRVLDPRSDDFNKAQRGECRR
jgi:uncharacterized surface protein with fasciclin (FAS1) repeats